jgi:hypothetical protein
VPLTLPGVKLTLALSWLYQQLRSDVTCGLRLSTRRQKSER